MHNQQKYHNDPVGEVPVRTAQGGDDDIPDYDPPTDPEPPPDGP